MDRTVCAPYLFARVLIECRNELVFLVIVDNHNEVVYQNGRRCRSEIEDRREAFERRAPYFVAVEIVGEKAKIIDVNVNTFAVRNRSLRGKAVLTVTASRRAA